MAAKQGGAAAPEAAFGNWQEAYDRLAAGDLATLTVEGLEGLAEAAFWLGRPREAIAARRRAYAAHRDADDHVRAALAAWLLFQEHYDLDETAVASGWLGRAVQHVEELHGSVEEGYVAQAQADWALYTGKVDDAATYAARAVEVGRGHRDRDLVALGQATHGRVLVSRGDVADGVALLDEAMLAAVGDELSPFVTGRVYCVLLSTCHQLGDIRRAAEWTDLAVLWCEEKGQDSPYPGLCRLHRCEIQSLRGQWSWAEEEALRATEELTPFGDYWVAEGMYLVGEIRCRRGELAEAEEAFRRAHELGRDPQPGMALLRLARGDTAGAASALRVALAAGGSGPMRRGRLLLAHIDAELEAGEVEAAQASAEAVGELAAATGVLLLRGMAAQARGAVLVARGDASTALPFLQEACAIFRELSFPYETAESRVLVGTAARLAGDEETARLEFETAEATFRRLGAVPGAERAAALARRSARPGGLTAREVEVLALVARGRTNRDIGAALYISEHTVARHLSNIFRKLGVASRSAATAFAFEHDLA